MKKTISIILLIHFIFYIGCTSGLNTLSYLREDETFKENKNSRIMYLMMENSDLCEGEILSVRSKTILIESLYQINDTSLKVKENFITEIPIENITSMVAEGRSKIGHYAKMGGFIGAFGVTGIWAAIIANEESKMDDENSEGGGLWIIFIPAVMGIFALSGSFIGMIVGAVASSFDKEYTLNESDTHDVLNRYARFPENEPRFFSELFPPISMEQVQP